MRTLQSLSFVLAAALSASGPLAAAEKKTGEPAYRLQWRDLSRMVRGYKVSLQLPSGVKLQGIVESVEPEALVMQVSGTSDRRAYPKGVAAVPRAEVTSLRLTKKTGYTWRVVWAAIGATAGLVAGGSIAVVAQGWDNPGTGIAVGAVAVAGLGYLAGWSADHKSLHIVIEPDAPRKSG